MLGSYPRYDSPERWSAHVEGMHAIGIRNILGIGAPNPPFPKTFREWNGQGIFANTLFSHSDSFAKTKKAVKKYRTAKSGIDNVLSYPFRDWPP
ncbi:MAG: hypothetical protein U5P10_13430 [Spirochaetia bacterium]|nr:hypothetical protein [Spirochaetia bacterium]